MCGSPGGRVSVQAEDHHECLVNRPQFLCGKPADASAESLHIDSTDLLDQHPGEITSNLDLRPERSRLSAP